jgi:hypothetical protein
VMAACRSVAWCARCLRAREEKFRRLGRGFSVRFGCGERGRRVLIGGLCLRYGLGFRGAIRSDGGGELRARAKLDESDDRRAPPVSVSRRRERTASGAAA